MKCETCGVEGVVLYRRNTLFNEYHCPACLRKQAQFDAAYAHLHTLLEEAACEWLTVWDGQGFEIDLSEYMSMIAGQVEKKYLAGELLPSVLTTPH